MIEARWPCPSTEKRRHEAIARTSPDGTGRHAVKIKLQLDLPVGSRVGPGKIQLLELIGSEGSLSRAAQAMGISYRRAWLFVQHINAAFDEAAISTPGHGHGGSPAQLTEFGKELIRRYRRLEAVAEAGGNADLDWLAGHQRPEQRQE